MNNKENDTSALAGLNASSNLTNSYEPTITQKPLKNQVFLDEKEARNVMTSEELTEAEKAENEQNKTTFPEKNKAIGVAEVLKQGIVSLIDEMIKEATPIVKTQLEAVKNKVQSLYSLDNNKDFNFIKNIKISCIS